MCYIFAIDDDPLMYDLLRTAFAATKHIVFSVPDGETALQAILIAKPDLILLDIRVPRMEGRAFLKTYWATEPNPVPVIITSANLAVELAEMTAGVIDYLPKPITIAALRECIRKHLKQQDE